MSLPASGGTPDPRRGTDIPLRPAALGVTAFAYAFLIAWVAYERTVPAPDMTAMDWWHGSHGAAGSRGAGAFLALATAAVYALLPLLVWCAHAARSFVRARRGSVFAAHTVFAALTASAAALVCLPVTALGLALGPAGGPAFGQAAPADSMTVVRLCLPVGLLLSAACGVPWAGGRPGHRPSRRETHPC